MGNSDFKYTIYLIENNSKTWYEKHGIIPLGQSLISYPN